MAKKQKEREADASEDTEDDAQWWSTGYDEVDRITDDDDIRLNVQPRGSKRVVMFIDGEGPEDKERWNLDYGGAPFLIWEYEIPVYGPDGGHRWGTTITCLKGRKTKDGKRVKDYVKIKAPDIRPYFAGFYTLADITGIWDAFERGDLDDDDAEKPKKPRRRRRRRKKKEPEEPELKMLPCKKRKLKELRKQANEHQGLRGTVWEVERTSKWKARIGDEWELIDKLSEEDIKKLIPEPMDRPLEYRTLLAPSTEEEIDSILSNRVPREELEDRDKDKKKKGRGRGRGRRDRDRDRDDDDDEPRRGRRRRRQRDDDDDDYEDEEPRGRSRRRDRDDDDDRDDEDEEPRGRSRRSRRSRDDDDDDRDDEDEEPRGRSGRRRRGRRRDGDDDEAQEDEIDF